MATNPAHDRIDEEIEALLGDSEVRTSLEEFEADLQAGKLEPGHSHDDARRIVGLPPGSPQR